LYIKDKGIMIMADQNNEKKPVFMDLLY